MLLSLEIHIKKVFLAMSKKYIKKIPGSFTQTFFVQNLMGVSLAHAPFI